MARVSIVLNNGTVVTAANTAVTPTVIYLGSTNNGASGLFTGHIRAIAAYSALSDANLATLSAVDTPFSIPATGGTVSAAASSAGDNTSTVVGQWAQDGVASSAGSNTSSAVAAPIQAAVAASAGANTATVVGQWKQDGIASSTGANTSTVVGQWLQNGVASSAGTNTSTASVVAWNSADKNAGISLSSDGLTATATSGGSDILVRGNTIGAANRYFEVKFTAFGGAGSPGVGIANSSQSLSSYPGSPNAIGYFRSGYYEGPGGASGNLATWGVGDVIGVELLASSAKFYLNGVLITTLTTLPSGSLYTVVSLNNSGDVAVANFGATPFQYLPSGDAGWNGFTPSLSPVATSTGANTATVVGQWKQDGVAASASANTSSVTATWKQDGVASSAGANTASATAAPIQSSVASAAGANTALVTATWIQAGTASSAGINTGSGTATWGQAGVASSAGTNTSSATASPIQAAVASSAGANTSAAIGTWLQSGVASSAGDNASTVTAQWGQAGVASSTGSNLSNAYYGTPAGVASSAGANTASVVGQWLQAGVASSAGSNTASVTGRWLQAGVASSAGSNTASVTSAPAGITGVASSAGSNTATAVGRWLQSGVASSVGRNTALVTSPAVMPAGALGIWYVDQYSASPSGIQNAVGSTALTSAGTADGNMYLAGGTTPSSGVLNFNSGEIGSVVLPSSVGFTEATVIYSCYKEADVANDSAIMADQASHHFWSVGEDVSGFGPGFQIFNNNWTGQQTGSLWDKVGNGWHISSHSYDTGSAECWIDGIKVIDNPASPGSRTIASFDIGVVNGTWNAGYKINALAIYPRKLSANEQASAYAVLRARAALSSITIPSTSPEKILFAMGDSITNGSFGDVGLGAANPGYVYAAARTISPVIRGSNLGVGGRTIATTNTPFDSTYGPMISAAVAAGGGRDIICTMALGTNDLLTYSSVANWLTDFATLCDKVRATGARLIVATIIPNIDPTFNARRVTANAVIRTWIGTHADAIMDFASDAIMGLDSTPSGGVYFTDGTHPSGAGHARLAPYLVAAVDYLSSAPHLGVAHSAGSNTSTVIGSWTQIASETGVAFSAGANISGAIGTWIQAGVATSIGGNTSTAFSSAFENALDFGPDFSSDFARTAKDFSSDFSADFSGGINVIAGRDFSYDFSGDFLGGFNAGISGDFNQDFSNDFAVFVGVHIVSGTATSAGSNIASVRGAFGQGASLDYNLDYSADFAVYGQLTDAGAASSTGSNISSMVGSWEAIPVPPYVPAPEPVVKQWVPASEFQRVQQPRADRVYRTAPELRRVQPSRATRIIQTGPSARRINLPNMKRRYG